MPHYLVMTATPIPRTLAMTVFGDLDVSIIRQSPPGRGRITTRVANADKWLTVMQHVRRRLEQGEQAYVVCPIIGKDPAADAPPVTGPKPRNLASAESTFNKLTRGPWQGLDVGLLHGSLSPTEKDATIQAFANGRLHALVATTVIEVGIDVPNATIMVIEHAERFGLSQLHQLRGRVGRGKKDSLCVLVAHGQRGTAAERLAVMARTTDGFKIAEADLRHRGPGQFFGTRQHGLPELRVADIIEDFALLEQARRDAFELVAGDPKLARPEHNRLLPALKRVFGQKLALIDAA
jgi:ATP-dependent DNA helicase RecG